MTTVTIGGLELARVIEDDTPIFDPGAMYPDSTADDFERERGWLMPRFFDEARWLLESCMQSYVFRSGGRAILIDTCVGNDKPGRRRDYWTRGQWPWLENLAAAGYAPEDIDLVLITHLHVDHVGWNTRLVDGRWEPTFPNARYVFTAADLDSLKARHAGGDGQYVNVYEDSVKPILDAGLADLVAVDHVVEDGIRFEPAPGHTPGQVNIRIASEGEEGLITADVFHHPIQARHPGWNSRACEHLPTAAATRRALFERAAGRDTLLLPAHFEPCRLRRENGGFRFLFD